MELVCQFCGVTFKNWREGKPGRTPKFCTRKCGLKYKNRGIASGGRRKSRWTLQRHDLTCLHCGADFVWCNQSADGKPLADVPPKYCSPKCQSHAAHMRAKVRGIKQYYRVLGTCEMCGEDVLQSTKTSTRRTPKRCQPCRRIPSRVKLPADHWARWYGKSSPWRPPKQPRPTFVAGTCDRCGATFVAHWSTTNAYRYCSEICGKREHGSRRRARKRGAYVADVWRNRIFVRDDWRCHICGRKVSKVKKTPHPRAATLDHLIPLAKGGTHEPANVATACFECNCIKSDGVANDQLMLVG